MKEMVNLYIEEWLSKRDAMIKSRQVVCDFYKACDTLTKKWFSPFVAVVNKFDQEKVLQSNTNKHGSKEEVLKN